MAEHGLYVVGRMREISVHGKRLKVKEERSEVRG